MSETISKPKESKKQSRPLAEPQKTYHFDAAAFIAALDSFDAEDYPGEQAETLALLRQMDAEAVAIGERAAPNFGPS